MAFETSFINQHLTFLFVLDGFWSWVFMYVKAKAISFCGAMSETESRSNKNSNDIKLFGRTIPLLQTQIEAITGKNSQVPPKSQFMVCLMFLWSLFIYYLNIENICEEF